MSLSKKNSEIVLAPAEKALILEVREAKEWQDPLESYIHLRELLTDYTNTELNNEGFITEEMQLAQMILIKIHHRILQTAHPVCIYPGDEEVLELNS